MFQCVLFGSFMIWFASITINLGPTFLSGALAASAGSYGSYGPAPSCPLVRGPYRHYVLNALWIGVNAVCVGLTLFHLKKLHRDLTKVRVQTASTKGCTNKSCSANVSENDASHQRNSEIRT